MRNLDTLKKTQETYGFLWQRNQGMAPPQSWHFDAVEKIIDEPIVRGRRGIDIGSGAGFDTYIMAKDNPKVEIVSIDLSNGVYATKKITSDLKNVRIVKGSVLDLPLKSNIFDFAYSFGVLHHTIEPKRGLSEIHRVLKKDCPVFLYLYEDHSENAIKYVTLKVVSLLRMATLKIPPRILYFLCWLLSPIVFLLFSFPSMILRQFRITRDSSNRFPFNFAKTPFSLRGDLFDRFSAPVELRFNKQSLYKLFNDCAFVDMEIRKLDDRAGWVVRGYKREC